MTFEAIRTKTGKRLAIWEMTNSDMGKLQVSIKDGRESLTCIDPLCKGALSIRCIDSTNRVPHFYHQRGNVNCITHVSESEQHRTGKLELIRYLLGLYPRATFETERSIKVTNGTKPARRIDVSCTTPNGELIAFELQLSRQDAKTTEARTNDLISGGYGNVVWVWGDPQKSYPSCKESTRYCLAHLTSYATMTITVQGEYRFTWHDCARENQERRRKIDYRLKMMQARDDAYFARTHEGLSETHNGALLPINDTPHGPCRCKTRITAAEFEADLQKTIRDNAEAARKYKSSNFINSPTR